MNADSPAADSPAADSPTGGVHIIQVHRLPARAAMFLVEAYRTYISPARPPTCRFMPTCSEYAVTALREWGLLRGLALAGWRLLKCGPWHPGGWDPVPRRHGRPHGGAPGTDPDEVFVADERHRVRTPTCEH